MKYDLIVISSYPPLGQTHGTGTVGVASYTKNTLTSLPSSKNILVLAEKLPGQTTDYQEKNIHVLRLWQRNSLILFSKLFQTVQKYPHTPILIEFEMTMFGKPFFNIIFIKFLLFLKIFSRKTSIVLHQVVLNFNEISGHIGQSPGNPTNIFLNFFAKIFYRLTILFSTKVIVFEQFLKDRLSKNNPKIVVIPHGVENKSNIFSKKNNKFFTITIFGFLAWYKGTDWAVKTFSDYFDRHPKSKFKLFIAGGPNPNHLHQPYYQKYLLQLYKIIEKHPKNIQITGFIDEKNIGQCYQQSDLILLPYRVGMSSSGPLSLAFTYHKPFLLSSKISPILKTPDINKITSQDLSFDLNSHSLFNKLIHYQKNPQALKQLSEISLQIASIRNWTNIGQQYLTCLNL